MESDPSCLPATGHPTNRKNTPGPVCSLCSTIPCGIWTGMGTSPAVPAGFVEGSGWILNQWILPSKVSVSRGLWGCVSTGKSHRGGAVIPGGLRALGGDKLLGKCPELLEPALDPKALAKLQQDPSICPPRANPSPKLGLLPSFQTSQLWLFLTKIQEGWPWISRQQILIHTLNQEFGISPGMMGTHCDKQVLLGLSGSFPSVSVSALSQFLHGCCSCTETSRKEKKNLSMICNSKHFENISSPCTTLVPVIFIYI